jgi:hypothetical protein
MAVTPELLIIGAVAGIAGLTLLAVRRAAGRPYDAATALLPPAQRGLLDALQTALAPDFVVFPRVRLGDVVRVRRRTRGRRRQVALARIADVSLGFVVCSAEDFETLAVVEIEERGHRSEAERARDRLIDSVLGAAGLPVVRVTAAQTYDATALRDAVLGSLRREEPHDVAPAAPPGTATGLNAGVVARGSDAGAMARARLVALRDAALRRLRRAPPRTQTLVALAAGGLVLATGAAWLLRHGPSSRPALAPPISVRELAPAPDARPTLRDTLDGLLKRSADDKPRPLPAAPPRPKAPPEPTAAPPEPPREIVGWREEKVPGKPLEQCLGPDREMNPDVVRCRTGYTQRVPIYR